MRLDKFFTTLGLLSRRECTVAAKKCRITVNGEVVKTPSVHINEETDKVTLDGKPVMWQRFFYIMLNKPEGTVSSTEESDNTVMKLLPEEYSRAGGFPCGRLDIDTVGLLLITNDGDTAHRLLSPKHHVAKAYRFRCAEPLSAEAVERLEGGIDLGDFVTAPAKVELSSPTEGIIRITEGKFHQIKRMLGAVGNGIEFLERIEFGPLKLDPVLSGGEWRALTEREKDELLK